MIYLKSVHVKRSLSLLLYAAGKGFVEAVKNKTEEELDEEVRMESEDVQVNTVHSNTFHIYIIL